MKRLQTLFYIIVLLLVIVGLAIASLMIFVDPNKMKPALIEQVKNRTGCQLTIDGDLGWSFYPKLAVNAKQVTLSNPTNPALFLDLQEVNVSSSLSTLWRRPRNTWRGEISAANVKWGTLQFQQVQSDFNLHRQFLALEPIKGLLYGGSVEGVVHVQNFSTMPLWTWSITVKGMQVQSFLEVIKGASKFEFSGVGDLQMQAGTQGKDLASLLNQMNGTASFHINQGAIYGIDLSYYVAAADAFIKKQPITVQNSNQTPFDVVSGSVTITNGVVSINDLTVSSPLFEAKGKGTVGLVSQAINMDIKVRPEKLLALPWGIPIQLTGTLQAPTARLDTSGIEKTVGKDQVDKVKEKISKEVQKRVPGKAGKLLEKLLGN